jgi:hypothetical protein
VTAWIVVGLLAGCAEYEVVLEQVSSTPLEVHVGDVVEIPAGILVTVSAQGYRNGEPLEPGVDIDLDVPYGIDVFDVSPTEVGDADFAIIGIAPGEGEIRPRVKGHPTEPIPVIVIEQ